MDDNAPKFIPASQFSIEELTEAYNHTRVDYMVPMPMNAARLAEYVDVYDVDMAKSIVAINGSGMLGLGMLGMRENRSWITRLGVLQNRRRGGIGEEICREMIEMSDDADIELCILEVIKGNVPAHSLFRKLNFEETRELAISRRAPNELATSPSTEAQWLEREDALKCLPERESRQAWTNEEESLKNADNIYGLRLDMNGSGSGWLVFQRTMFNLSRVMYKTEDGDPQEIMFEMLIQLHSKFPQLDTYVENIPVDDPHLAAFVQIGYIEVFRRVEMVRAK
ncbi:MAG: GNAT family N-acetyltransferase [Chloroflexi bacterium]|nr:GNAT family N-acetyltransferase [Chloroflexota bacterium]